MNEMEAFVCAENWLKCGSTVFYTDFGCDATNIRIVRWNNNFIFMNAL